MEVSNITAIAGVVLGGLLIAAPSYKSLYAAGKRWLTKRGEPSWQEDMAHCAALLESLGPREDPAAKEAVKAVKEVIIPAVVGDIGHE